MDRPPARLAQLTDAGAVRRAMAEFDRVGREVFLAQHGFGQATRYVLVDDGREYDSKAIAGAALGYQPGVEEALRGPGLHGGLSGAVKTLRRLGFFVVNTQEDHDEPPLGRAPEAYVAAIEALDGPLDRHAVTTRRAEQSLLRGVLGLYASGDAGCDLCGRTLPVTLLVAAHVKPRSLCSPAERRDVPHVVMRACLLGCDALFERHLLLVGADGRLASPGPMTGALKQHVDDLTGKCAPGFTPRRAPYLAWHASHP